MKDGLAKKICMGPVWRVEKDAGRIRVHGLVSVQKETLNTLLFFFS